MVMFRPTSREVMAANHKAAAPKESASPLRNVRPVLSLDGTEYVTFRGRAYGVPPVPWREGTRLNALWIEALSYTQPMSPETAARYHAVIRQLPALCWSLMRPVGVAWRALQRLGLHRNPLEDATEQELVDVALFLRQCRMKSSVGLHPARLVPSPST